MGNLGADSAEMAILAESLAEEQDLWPATSPADPRASGAAPVDAVGAVDCSPTWVDVLVDVPGTPGLFTYRLPPVLAVQPGDILSVPFGAQQVGAIAIALRSTAPPDLDPHQIRPIEAIISAGFFPPTTGASSTASPHTIARP